MHDDDLIKNMYLLSYTNVTKQQNVKAFFLVSTICILFCYRYEIVGVIESRCLLFVIISFFFYRGVALGWMLCVLFSSFLFLLRNSTIILKHHLWYDSHSIPIFPFIYFFIDQYNIRSFLRVIITTMIIIIIIIREISCIIIVIVVIIVIIINNIIILFMLII